MSKCGREIETSGKLYENEKGLVGQALDQPLTKQDWMKNKNE